MQQAINIPVAPGFASLRYNMSVEDTVVSKRKFLIFKFSNFQIFAWFTFVEDDRKESYDWSNENFQALRDHPIPFIDQGIKLFLQARL